VRLALAPALIAAGVVLAWTVRGPPPAGAEALRLRAPAIHVSCGALVWLLTGPVVSLLLRNARFEMLLPVHGRDIAWSLAVATASGIACAAWAAFVERAPWPMEVAWAASALVPSVALAGSVLAFAAPIGLATNIPMIVFASCARYAFVAWWIVRAGIESIPPRAAEAASVCGLSRWTGWRAVVWPAVRDRLPLAAAAVALLALGDTGISQVLAPPGRTSLIASIYGLIHYGYDQTVAALSSIALAAV
jgi:ABC-type Fe3+ transport system permease subunit